MASRVSVLSSCILLSVFLAIASSSTDYGYVPTPDLQKPNPQDKPLPTNPGYGDRPKTEKKDKRLPTNAGYEKPSPEVKDKPAVPSNPGYDGKPYPEVKDKPVAPTKPGYDGKPYPQVKDKLIGPTNPSYGEKPKLEEILAKTIAVQGLVLCKSGSKYFPLQGD